MKLTLKLSHVLQLTTVTLLTTSLAVLLTSCASGIKTSIDHKACASIRTISVVKAPKTKPMSCKTRNDAFTIAMGDIIARAVELKRASLFHVGLKKNHIGAEKIATKAVKHQLNNAGCYKLTKSKADAKFHVGVVSHGLTYSNFSDVQWPMVQLVGIMEDTKGNIIFTCSSTAYAKDKQYALASHDWMKNPRLLGQAWTECAEASAANIVQTLTK